jgi:hypothetical protein
MIVTRSSISKPCILSEGEVNGRWVLEVRSEFNHPAGTLVCDPAPLGEDWENTFTAPNGKRYWDLVAHSRFTERVHTYGDPDIVSERRNAHLD